MLCSDFGHDVQILLSVSTKGGGGTESPMKLKIYIYGNTNRYPAPGSILHVEHNNGMAWYAKKKTLSSNSRSYLYKLLHARPYRIINFCEKCLFEYQILYASHLIICHVECIVCTVSYARFSFSSRFCSWRLTDNGGMSGPSGMT